MRNFHAGIILVCITALVATGLEARELKAYIDLKSKIIVGRDESFRGSGSFQEARDDAAGKARDNIAEILRRQPVDPDSADQRTIGEYLKAYPEKEKYLDQFLASAKVFSETENERGYVEVTLLLPVEGPGGYRVMLARLTGRALAASTQKGRDKDSPKTEEEAEEQLAGRTPEELGRPYVVGVVEFYNDTKHKDLDLGDIFTDRLKSRFTRDRRFIILSEQSTGESIAEAGLSVDALWYADVSESLRIEGLDGLVMGSVLGYEPLVKKTGIGETGYLETGFEVDLDLRVLNAETGRWSYYQRVPVKITERKFTLQTVEDAANLLKAGEPENEDGLAARALEAAVDKAEAAIRSTFPLEGYVLKVVGDKVYISLARSDEISEGDRLDVYRIGDMLYDPVTGEEIDRIRDRIGEVRVAEINDAYSQAVTTGIPSEPIIEGDIVSVQY